MLYKQSKSCFVSSGTKIRTTSPKRWEFQTEPWHRDGTLFLKLSTIVLPISQNTLFHKYPARNFLLHVESAPPSTSNTCAHTKRYSSTLCDSSLIAVLVLVFSCSKSLPQLNLYLWESFKRGQSSHLTVSLVIDAIVSLLYGRVLREVKVQP